MRQEEWRISTIDGYKIYGVTDFSSSEKANKCLVIVHGLTGHMDEYLLKSAANYFCMRGYDIIRFNLYHWDKGARRLSECTLQTHASDLNVVLVQKATKYKKIFLSGHSYGGPTIMIAQPHGVNAISLWDPTFNFPKLFNNDKFFKKEGSALLLNGGCECLVNQDFIDEAQKRYDIKESLALSEKLSGVPIQVLTAAGEGSVFSQDKQSWHSAGHEKNERHFIKEADHCFHHGNTLQDLLDRAFTWFERF